LTPTSTGATEAPKQSPRVGKTIQTQNSPFFKVAPLQTKSIFAAAVAVVVGDVVALVVGGDVDVEYTLKRLSAWLKCKWA